MGRNCFAAAFLFIFIVTNFSSASLLSKHRTLIGEPTNNKSTVPGKESPVASPPPPPSLPGNGSGPKPVDDPKKQKTDSPLPTKTPNADPAPNGLNNGTKKGEGKDPKTKTKDPNQVPDSTPKDNPKSNNEQEPGSGSQPLDGGKEKDKEGSPQGGKAKNKDDPPAGGKAKNKDLPEGSKTKNKDDPPEGGKAKNKKDLPEGGNGKNKDIEKKDDNVTDSPNADKESCQGVIKTCKAKDVVACIKSFNIGSKEVAILVENVGDSTLKGNLSAENTTKDLEEIPKHHYKKVNMPLDIDKSTKITVKAGHGECVLLMDPPVSGGNFFIRFPSYEKVVTPINGAYFLIVTVLIFGGTWACCKVRMRKQRTGGGVPYQELEMGLPESVSATAVETAEGWDQGWDDDWDGDNAVKSPGGHIAGSISSNGLTSRSTNKDGWENDWDD